MSGPSSPTPAAPPSPRTPPPSRSPHLGLDLAVSLLLLALACLPVWLAPGLGGSWRAALGLVALLALPGYLASVAFFPGRRDISGPTRGALTLGYSLIAIPLVALVVSGVQTRITPQAIAAGVFALSLLLAGVGLLRRQRLPRAEVFVPDWSVPGTRAGLGLAGLSLAVIVGLGGLIGLLRTQVPMTEFYMLNRQGQMDAYPNRQQPTVEVQLVVRNLEGSAQSYRIQPSSCPLEQNSRQVASGQEWKVTWRCPSAQLEGVGQVHFSLYRASDPAPYRSLQLKVH